MSMKRIALLMLCALVACDESTAPSDEPEAFEEVAEVPEPTESVPDHDHDHDGDSMCDLYDGQRFEVEMEDGEVLSLPVPVECNPHVFYDGYPSDSDPLLSDRVVAPRGY